jgi:hypothetical protein
MVGLFNYEYLKLTDLGLDQSFGIDLEVRARADRKRVPVVITSILTYLDHRKRYPITTLSKPSDLYRLPRP